MEKTLERVTYIVKRFEWLTPSASIADGEKHTVFPKRGSQLFDEKDQQSSADDCQVEIVDKEQVIQLVSWPIPHYLAAGENDCVICHQHGDGGLHCKHRR